MVEREKRNGHTFDPNATLYAIERYSRLHIIKNAREHDPYGKPQTEAEKRKDCQSGTL